MSRWSRRSAYVSRRCSREARRASTSWACPAWARPIHVAMASAIVQMVRGLGMSLLLGLGVDELDLVADAGAFLDGLVNASLFVGHHPQVGHLAILGGEG